MLKLLNTIQPPDNNLTDNGVGFGTNYDAALQEMIKGYQQSNVGPLQNKPGLTNSGFISLPMVIQIPTPIRFLVILTIQVECYTRA